MRKRIFYERADGLTIFWATVLEQEVTSNPQHSDGIRHLRQ